MSHNINNPSQSKGNISNNLQNEGGNNGQQILVLTPDMLKKIGFTHPITLCQSKSQIDNNIETISPIKIDTKINKTIIQEVLKLSKENINSHHVVENTNSSSKSPEIMQNDTMPLQITQVKNVIINEQLTDNLGQSAVSDISDCVDNISEESQSKTSVESNFISQIVSGEHNQEKSIVIQSPRRNRIVKNKTSGLKLKTISNNKSLKFIKLSNTNSQLNNSEQISSDRDKIVPPSTLLNNQQLKIINTIQKNSSPKKLIRINTKTCANKITSSSLNDESLKLGESLQTKSLSKKSVEMNVNACTNIIASTSISPTKKSEIFIDTVEINSPPTESVKNDLNACTNKIVSIPLNNSEKLIESCQTNLLPKKSVDTNFDTCINETTSTPISSTNESVACITTSRRNSSPKKLVKTDSNTFTNIISPTSTASKHRSIKSTKTFQKNSSTKKLLQTNLDLWTNKTPKSCTANEILIKTPQKNSSPKKSITVPKLNTRIKKNVTKLNSTIDKHLITQEDKSIEKLIKIKKNRVVSPSKKKVENLSRSSSSLSNSTALMVNQSPNVNEDSTLKDNEDQKMSSMITITDDDIVRKDKLSQSKRQSNAKTVVEKIKPSTRMSRRISRPKVFENCVIYGRGQRTSTESRETINSNNAEEFTMNNSESSPTKQGNVHNNHETKSKDAALSQKHFTMIEKTAIKRKKSDINPTSNNFDINSILSTTSQCIEKFEDKKSISTVNKSKIINDNPKINHDNIAHKSEENPVPESNNVPESLNTKSVLKTSITKKSCKSRKSTSTDTSIINSSEQTSNDKISILKTNDIDSIDSKIHGNRRTRSSKVEVINEYSNNDKSRGKKFEGKKMKTDGDTGEKVKIKVEAKKEEKKKEDVVENEENEIDEHIPKRTNKRQQHEYIKSPRNRSLETSKSIENGENSKCDSTIEVLMQNEVICGKCGMKMQRNQWIKHNLQKHNNMGWCEGDKVPDYENNEKLWKSVLSAAHKSKKGSLTCEKCLAVKRSVVGFISHYQFCGKSDEERHALKWVCPECHGKFMPSSQDYHERMHRDEKRKNELSQMTVNNNNDENINGIRKRRAAEKAASKISRFTSSIKDDEEVPAKKIKLTASKLKNFIVEPPKTDSIPSIWKSGWTKALAANELASCRQPGCTFSTSSFTEICDHYGVCKFKPTSKYVCKICKYMSETFENIKIHMKEQHSDKINLQEDSDFSGSRSSGESDHESNETVRKHKISGPPTHSEKSLKHDDRAIFLRNEKYYCKHQGKSTFTPSLQWTLEFELNNYRLSLFEDFQRNDFILLTNNEADKYLPNLKESMRFQQVKNRLTDLERKKITKDDEKWTIWNRFESSVIDGFPTFFVGGPVWSMAWLPIPVTLYSENVDQYLAISTHSKMDDSFAMGKSYKFKNIIQIWNMGYLDHSKSHITQTPQLSYAIAHNNGTIWCMEWCPSGAYETLNNLQSTTTINSKQQNINRRMGLLATACSDGCVHIYSIIFPEDLHFQKTNEYNLPIYKTNPIITLQINQLLHNENKNNWQCLTLSWSKLYGHDTIAAGFTNGYVALWNLKTKSPLLLTKNDTTLIISSYRHFYAHKEAVTSITIIPLKGKRYLATVSIDRYSKFWDLEDVSSCISDVKKGVSVNSTWLTHWPNILTSYDDVLGLGHTVTSLISLREPCSKTQPILPTNSTTYGLASSDYANGICHGTLAGEVVAIFPFELLYLRELDKIGKKRWLVSSIDIVDFKAENLENNKINNDKKKIDSKQSNLKEHIYMPETYEECSERFGIIFHDDVDNLKQKTKKSDRKNQFNSHKMKEVPVEQYNFTSVNRISWNPNSWSYLWFGVGYQNGLIRILHFKTMAMQDAIRALLPNHIKQVLKRENEISNLE